MSRGRTPRSYPESRLTVRRAAEAALGRRVQFEELEDRRLLTTLTGGQTFTYWDASETRVRITLAGDITAEFLAARASGIGRPAVRDLLPPPPTGGQTYPGLDLFSIYVAEAGAGASIYITRIDEQGRNLPYTGDPGTISPTTIRTVTVPPPIDALGGVYIGTRTGPDDEGLPITSVRNSNIYGVRPSTRTIYAGLQTADGVNLDKVFIAGAISGIVNVEGSVNTFYAGGIITGDTNGLSEGQKPLTSNNFNIAGDLQNLYVGGSVGTNATYDFRTGVNIRVGGRLGYVHVNGNWYAQLQNRNASGAPPVDTPSLEAETYFPNVAARDGAFTAGQLGDPVTGTNDSADGLNAQFAYTDGNNQMSWKGTLQSTLGDTVDNYSLPLMAGQTATLELVTVDPNDDTILAGATLQVIDPTGRVVASDLSGPTSAENNQQFQYTAKIPGVYTLSVGGSGTYRLQANAAGTVSVGGVIVGGATRFRELGNGIALRTGDLGAFISNGDISAYTQYYNTVASSINLSRGNLRALYSNARIGVPTSAGFGLLDLVIPKGSVGHIRAGDSISINPSATSSTDEPIPSAGVAGDYQRVEATGDISSQLIANGRIGTVIAGSFNANAGAVGFTSSIIAANADERGSDGTIDMIYCAGDFGTLASGGPGLFNGLDGNIKYVYVGGEVYRDRFFGNTILADTFLENGRAINFVDDSGARAVIRPTNTVTTSAAPAGSIPGTTTTDPITGATTQISFDPVTNALVQTVTTPGSLDYKAYGVRGIGGQVMINLHSTSSLDIVGNTRGQLDIGNIVTNATGSAPQIGTLGLNTDSDGDGIPDVLVDINRGVTTTVGYPATGGTTPTDPNTPAAGEGFTTIAPVKNEINFYGPAEINAFHIVGSATGTDATAVASTNITAINNFTSGEIVSVDATNLGIINARRVGLMDSISPGTVTVPGNMGTAAPYDDFSRGINVTGPIISVLARDGIGNVSSTSTINVVNPNSDGKNARGVSDGIDGAIHAGTFNVVQIGEGISFGGTGNVYQAGVFAENTINNVVGNNADIRGPVIARQYINSVVLTDGSIVNTTVGTVSSALLLDGTEQTGFAEGLYTAGAYTAADPSSNLGFAMNQLLIRGNGGVIGSNLLFGNFANITVEGFGMINTYVGATAASNVNGQINVDGFGIRASRLSMGSSVREVNVNGNGRVLSTADYSSRVNQSGGTRRQRFDAYSGRVLGGSNDLNRYFGTSRSSPRLSGSTNAGVIADTQILGLGTLGSLDAYAISTADVITPVTSPSFLNRIAFASNIGDINVRHTVSGLQLRTGKMDSFTVGTNLQRADIGVAGELGNVAVGGTIRGTTNIQASRANGSINSIVVKGGLYGRVRANRDIGTIAADVIGADISSGRSISRISTNGNVLTGTYIHAAKEITRTVIGGDFENDARIEADDFGVFRVAGANLGDKVNL